MAGQPYPRPPSSRKPKKLSREETRDRMLWKMVPVGFEGHHCIYEQVLRNHGQGDKVYDLRNRLVIERRKHERHHSGAAPLFRSELPDSVWEFAYELDGGEPEGYFVDWLYRNYGIDASGAIA